MTSEREVDSVVLLKATEMVSEIAVESGITVVVCDINAMEFDISIVIFGISCMVSAMVLVFIIVQCSHLKKDTKKIH